MNFIEIVKKEFDNFSTSEKILFPLIIMFTIIISFVIKDSKIALISAVCGISYTLLAGKGRVSCYFIGIIGTLCYCYISLVNALYGQLILYALYYFPMELIGIYQWKKHFKKDTREIIKTKLSYKERIIYLFCAVFAWVITSFLLMKTSDLRPIMDSFALVFSVLGQYLTVKRCIEQWYIWTFVNIISMIMWIYAYIDGSNCFATILMWAVYLVLGLYFLVKWRKEIN